MARIGTLQPSFSTGEISPRLYGRADVAKYQSAAEAVENFIVRPEGGLMRRHGTRFIGENWDHTKKPLLVPFIFSTIQAYMLVFEDSRIRFYKDRAPITSASNTISGITKANPAVVTYVGADNFANGDHVLVTGVVGMGQVNNREFTVANVNVGANTFELSGINSTGYDTYTSGGTVSKIYTVTSPYLEADLPNLTWSQSADTLYLVHPSYAPRTLTRSGDTSWTLTTTDLSKGPWAPLNTDDSVRVLCTIATTYQPGETVTLQANSAIFTANHVGSYFRMQEIYLADNDVSPWVTGAAGQVVVAGDQVSNAGNVYEEAGVGSGLLGVLAPTHTEGEAWDNYIPVTNHYHKWRYLHSRWAVVQITAFTDSKNVTGTIKTYLCNGLAPLAKTITNVTNSGDAAALCRVTSAAHGFSNGDYVTIAGVTGATQANGDWKIKSIAANTFDLVGSSAPGAFTGGGSGAKRFATWLWQYGAFSTDRGYPAAVALHEQRLVYANTTKQPFGFWASKTGDYPNFYPGTNDGDPISYNIAANQADPIRWLASASDLVLGTLSQEFAAFGGGLGDPITPANTRIVPQSGEGSNSVKPVKVGTEVLFSNRAGRKVFALRYDTAGNAYQSTDLLELAEHLTISKQISRLAWAKNPASLLWALFTDGTLAAATYRPDQQILAWHRHPLSDGTVESIAVIPSPDGMTDDLYLVVNRTVNGATRRYVEYLASPFEPTSSTDKTSMGFMDCALQYSGASTTTLTGLTHLEAKTVKVVGGGALQADKTVTNGTITLDTAVTSAWVGLAYTSRLRTVRPEGSAQGTAQAKTKRIPRLSVLVHNSMGGTAGPGSESVMDELVKRDASDPMDASPPLRSGWYDAFIASDFDLDGRLAIVQSDPLPLDILAIAPLQSTQEA